MNMDNETKRVILVDAESLNHTVFDITVNFERMLNRRIPAPDMRKWIYAAACDGYFPVGAADATVVRFLVGKSHESPEYLGLSAFSGDEASFAQGGMNFRVEVKSHDCGNDDAFVDELREAIRHCASLSDIVCVPGESIAVYVGRILADRRSVRATVLAGEPLRGAGFGQAFVSSSVSYALGVSDEEIMSKGAVSD